MKYLNILLLLFLFTNVCYGQEPPPPGTKNAVFRPAPPITLPNFSLGLKWHDSLFKHLPKNIDTNVIVKDVHGKALKFAQYVKPVFNSEAILYQDNGEWKLHRLTKSAYDSLGREDFAIARIERALAYRNHNPTTNWRRKLDEIAQKLAKADYVVVNKSKREMLIKRKGTTIKTLKINMGFAPVGQKLADGDGRTPEGIYHLDLKTNREDGFYKSMWISYPNEEDKLRSKEKGLKPGVGIMIHGTTKSAINAKDWTAGCIALQNKDMDILFAIVESGTPIEIRK